MILDPGLVQWKIDTGSRPSVVDDQYRNPTYYRAFLQILEDLRCNSVNQMVCRMPLNHLQKFTLKLVTKIFSYQIKNILLDTKLFQVMYVGVTYTGNGPYRSEVPAVSSRSLDSNSLFQVTIKYIF